MTKEHFFREVLRLTDEELIAQAVKYSDIKEYKRGHFFVEENEPILYIGFLMNDGLFRMYSSNSNGQNNIECFVYQSGMPICVAYPLNDISSVTVECVENSVVLRFPIQNAQYLLSHFSECIQLAFSLQSEAALFHLNVQKILSSYRGNDRMHQLEMQYPELALKLSTADAASFLGISERTLYRGREKNA